MMRFADNYFNGIYAATINPMRPDYVLDEDMICQHVASISQVPGIRGLLINGHAGENFMTTAAEKKRVIELSQHSSATDCLLVSGVNAECSLDAAKQAEDAARAGADAILIFPANSWALGPHPDTVIKHHQIIGDACQLPIMLYQAPVNAGALAYDSDLLSQLVQLADVVAIKEGSWEVARYEANRRLVKNIAPHVAVMASGDEHLLSSFVLGSDGSQVSLAVLIPDVIVALEQAVRQGDLSSAHKAHETIYPLAKIIYGKTPASFATARLKTCLKLLGRLSHDTTRPPIGPLAQDEIQALQRTLVEIGLL